MSLKRVLLVTLEFPPFPGGVANYLAGFISGISADVHCLVSGDGEDEQGVTYTRLLSRFLWPRWLRGVFAILKSIKKEGPFDVIVISHVLPVGLMVLCASLLSSHVPRLVTICHGLDIATPRASAWKRFLVTRVLRKSELVICNSEYTKSILQAYGISDEKVVVVYPSLLALPEQVSFERGVPLMLLTIARLIPRKGIDSVLLALPAVVKQVPQVKYVIAGSGPDLLRLKKLAFSLGMDRYVWFAQEVDVNRKDSLLRSAHVFVMPARSQQGDVEGFGMVFLEAAAYGVPSVTSTEGGVVEAVEHEQSGVHVDSTNIERLSHVLITLLEQQEMRVAMGKYARERVEQKFTPSVTVKVFNDYLDTL